MISKKMLGALNEQIAKEFYSAYLYLQMSAWFEHKSLPGMSTWMKVQAQEEVSHGVIFFNYICERGGLAEMGAIDKPQHQFKDALDVFRKILEHEQLVTASINNLMDIAISEKDYATKSRLDWFIDEQVEEESSAQEIIGKLELIGNNTNVLFMLDNELGTRTFVTPAPLAGGAA